MKDNYLDDIFTENDDMPQEDTEFFNKKLNEPLTDVARNFFEQMRKKEEGEFAGAADLILSEFDNPDEIYIVRYYYTEYRIGRGKVGNRRTKAIYVDLFVDAYNSDLFELLDYHISLGEWLEKNDYQGLNFNGNYSLR